MRKHIALTCVLVLAAACSNSDPDVATTVSITTVETTLAVSSPTTTAAPTGTTSSSTTTTAAVTTTTTTTTTVPPKGRLVISGTGDVNLDPSYVRTFAAKGYEYAFSGLQDIFLQDDLTIVNLECPASDLGKAAIKAFVFQCDKAALPVMRDAGVEVANLANNHSQDHGRAAMIESRGNLRAVGIAPVGVGINEQQAYEAAFFDINGWRIAVLGFGAIGPPAWLAGPKTPGMADGDNTDAMVAAIKAADLDADLVFVSIHWGVELDLKPRQEDIAKAHAMIDAGADGIFGHHPHRLQPLDHYNDRPIAWSLGNFVWPNFSRLGSTTAVAQFVVEPDGSVRGCLVRAFIEDAGHPVLREDYEGPCPEDG